MNTTPSKRQKKSNETSASTSTAAANEPNESTLLSDNALIGNFIAFVTLHAYVWIWKIIFICFYFLESQFEFKFDLKLATFRINHAQATLLKHAIKVAEYFLNLEISKTTIKDDFEVEPLSVFTNVI